MYIPLGSTIAISLHQYHILDFIITPDRKANKTTQKLNQTTYGKNANEEGGSSDSCGFSGTKQKKKNGRIIPDMMRAIGLRGRADDLERARSSATPKECGKFDSGGRESHRGSHFCAEDWSGTSRRRKGTVHSKERSKRDTCRPSWGVVYSADTTQIYD